MMGSQDAPVPGQVVEVVHDDSNEEVEDEEAADDKESDEVEVGEVGAAAVAQGVVVVRLGVTDGFLGGKDIIRS